MKIYYKICDINHQYGTFSFNLNVYQRIINKSFIKCLNLCKWALPLLSFPRMLEPLRSHIDQLQELLHGTNKPPVQHGKIHLGQLTTPSQISELIMMLSSPKRILLLLRMPLKLRWALPSLLQKLHQETISSQTLVLITILR